MSEPTYQNSPLHLQNDKGQTTEGILIKKVQQSRPRSEICTTSSSILYLSLISF